MAYHPAQNEAAVTAQANAALEALAGLHGFETLKFTRREDYMFHRCDVELRWHGECVIYGGSGETFTEAFSEALTDAYREREMGRNHLAVMPEALRTNLEREWAA